MLPFWISIAALSLLQGVTVALPGQPSFELPRWLRGRRWALVLPLSVIAFVFIARTAERASGEGLTYLALVAVPLLAVVALWRLIHRARPALAVAALALFALAWADRAGLAGEAAGDVLVALSCAALGVLIAAVTPPRWLAAGIFAMAVADTWLVVSDLLERPNEALNAAHPAAGLPQLQSEVFGSAVMGYGDLFVAAAFGALLAREFGRSRQLRGAALTAAISLCLDLLFFAVSDLPATVPVALALAFVLSRRRAAPARDRDAHLPRVAPAPTRGLRSPLAP